MAYESLAKVYDKIMREDVDYGEWARYTDSLFCESGIRGNKILDLGCGTGGIIRSRNVRRFYFVGNYCV